MGSKSLCWMACPLRPETPSCPFPSTAFPRVLGLFMGVFCGPVCSCLAPNQICCGSVACLPMGWSNPHPLLPHPHFPCFPCLFVFLRKFLNQLSASQRQSQCCYSVAAWR